MNTNTYENSRTKDRPRGAGSWRDSWVIRYLSSIIPARLAAMASNRSWFEITESEYRAIFNSSFDGIIVVDESGIIRCFNPAAGTMFGLRPAELTGQNLEVLLSDEESVKNGNFTKRLFTPGNTPNEGVHELLARHKDGSVFTVSVVLSDMNIAGQRLITLMLRDITEQKAMAQALLEAKEAAESATQVKSQFLANMSHEIRSPMTGVIGMLDLLKGTELNTQQTRYLELAEEAGVSVLKLINDILDLSKVESGNITLETIPFDLVHLVSQVMDLLGQQAIAKGLDLIIEISEGTPTSLNGDPLRLREVLVNLVNNAIKFTDEGTVQICVEKTAETDFYFDMRFEVADTGCGISREKHAELFKPYEQADRSTTRLHGGTGLGLSICRQLIELMGGEIDFFSRPGEGTTFWFTARFSKTDSLPDTASSPDAEIKAVRQHCDSNMATVNLPRHRVLVVDDNEINRFLCREVLIRLGVEVVTVVDGQQALDALNNAHFDLILMDCEMPVMDGYTASRKIRESEDESGLDRIPIIALTAHAMEGDREFSLDAGMDDHLTKPFKVEQLHAILETWLTTIAPDRVCNE